MNLRRVVHGLLVAGLITADTEVSGEEATAQDTQDILAAAAFRHLADKCATEPCCISVDGKAPRTQVMKLLKDLPNLRALFTDRLLECPRFGLHALDVKVQSETRGEVTVREGGLDLWLVECTYYLRLTGGTWRVIPGEAACPIT